MFRRVARSAELCLSLSHRLQQAKVRHFLAVKSVVSTRSQQSKFVEETTNNQRIFPMSLEGKVAIVTGASKGIGAAIAKEFAANGAILCLTGRNKAELDTTAAECHVLGAESKKPLIVVGDLTDANTRQKIVETAIHQLRKIDILVNNAGVMEFNSASETTLETFDRVFDINFRAPYDLCRLVVPHLIHTKGCIINMSSVVAVRPVLDSKAFPRLFQNPVATPYCVSKAALDQLTTCLATELGPKAVRVVSVNPGVISTDLWSMNGMTAEQCEEVINNLASTHALKRGGNVSEVSRVVAFLASDAASFITGSRVMVDGGMMAVPPGSG